METRESRRPVQQEEGTLKSYPAMTQLFMSTCSSCWIDRNRQTDRLWTMSTTIQDVSNKQRFYYSDIFIIYFISLINKPTLTTMSRAFIQHKTNEKETLMFEL